MALPTTYSTGTATINANDTAVTGQGTTWLTSGLQAGDLFWAGGASVRIASVNSNTSITLAFPWPGATRASATYEVRFTPDASRAMGAARAILDALANGVLYAFSGLVGAADRLPYFTGAGTAALATFTAYGRSLVATANAAAARTALQLAAIASSGSAADLIGGILPDGVLPSRLRAQAALATDANAITDTGAYRVAGSAANIPLAVFGYVYHSQYDSLNARQTWFRFNNLQTYERAMVAGVWGAWERVYGQAAGLNELYAQVAGPTADKGQSIGSGSRRYSTLWAAKANIGGDAESGRISAVLNGLAERALDFATASSLRWSLRVSGSESGSDAGSVFTIDPYSDAGAIKTAAVSIVRSTGVVTFSAPPKLPQFTIATLPAASAYSRCIVYVSNGSGGKCQATSNGTNWVWGDGTVVS